MLLLLPDQINDGWKCCTAVGWACSRWKGVRKYGWWPRQRGSTAAGAGQVGPMQNTGGSLGLVFGTLACLLFLFLFLLMLCFFLCIFLQFQENAAIALARLAKGHEVRVLFFACGAAQFSGTWLIFVSHVYSCCSTSYGISGESRFCFIAQNKTTFGGKKKFEEKKMRYLIDFAILVRTTPKKRQSHSGRKQ